MFTFGAKIFEQILQRLGLTEVIAQYVYGYDDMLSASALPCY